MQQRSFINNIFSEVKVETLQVFGVEVLKEGPLEMLPKFLFARSATAYYFLPDG